MIVTTAIGPASVFATDVDGDGDVDVLSAFIGDDKIAWYESNGGSPPTFTTRVISTTADCARSVFATDVDGDGDIDVLSASSNDDKIAWYESIPDCNENGRGQVGVGRDHPLGEGRGRAAVAFVPRDLVVKA